MKYDRRQYLGIAIGILLFCSSCTVGRFFIYNVADVRDHKKFSSNVLEKPKEAFLFHYAKYPKSPKTIKTEEGDVAFETFLDDNKTLAFLIIKNDSIHYERYFAKYSEESIVPSFSMAKSFTSILIGCAISDGLIESIDDRVIKYLPEFGEKGWQDITIKHVLQMTSGIKFNEGYFNPFGEAASFYYGRNLKKQTLNLKLARKPGVAFEYVSGNTQILGQLLERVLDDETISSYMERKLWKPLGMEYDATWSMDSKKNGMEKVFCCFNARARDFAKIGKLYMNKGRVGSEQIVDERWVSESTKIDTTEGSAWNYQYQWWLPTDRGDFMAEGILGQYIYVYPEKELIIVRLGRNYGDVDWSQVLSHFGSQY